MNKCVFLDRDGVLNVDDPKYTYLVSKFHVIPGVPQALYEMREAGYLLIVVTNQSGIARKIYTRRQMDLCHIYLQDSCDHVIDHIYFSPYHETVTNSLTKKPGSLLFEKAIARFNIDPKKSWMIGDRSRDLTPAKKLGIKTIQIGDDCVAPELGDYKVDDLIGASNLIRGISKTRTFKKH
ncbi:MAG TPA: HAD-IIIA family hydrolase [Cyclobacteriaceae bacterium]|nr:HAD-IIIA family hydrolase [Cyclobacteriaceae bacterium]